MAGAWERPVVTTTRRGEVGFRAVGVLLLVIPFLPIAAMFGPYADARGLFGPVDWVLGTGIFLTSTWLAGMLAPPRLCARCGDGDVRWRPGFDPPRFRSFSRRQASRWSRSR